MKNNRLSAACFVCALLISLFVLQAEGQTPALSGSTITANVQRDF